MMPSKRKHKKLSYVTSVLDIETDPFMEWRIPKPFAAGFYFYEGEEAASEVYLTAGEKTASPPCSKT